MPETTASDVVASPSHILSAVEGPGFARFPRTHAGMLSANMVPHDDRVAAITGTPTIGARGTVFRGGQDMTTLPETETAEMTIYKVITLLDNGSTTDLCAMLLTSAGPSVLDATRTVGITLRQNNAVSITIQARWFDGTTSTSYSRSCPYTVGVPLLLCARIGANYMSLKNWTANSGTDANYTGSREVSTSAIRCGSSGVGAGVSYRGRVEDHYERIHRGVMHTPVEEAAVVAKLRAQMAVAALPGL